MRLGFAYVDLCGQKQLREREGSVGAEIEGEKGEVREEKMITDKPVAQYSIYNTYKICLILIVSGSEITIAERRCICWKYSLMDRSYKLKFIKYLIDMLPGTYKSSLYTVSGGSLSNKKEVLWNVQ